MFDCEQTFENMIVCYAEMIHYIDANMMQEINNYNSNMPKNQPLRA